MSAWLLPACLGFMTRKTPFHLVELDCGDGLNLIADYLERPPLYSEDGALLPGPEGYRDCPYPVLSRTGLGPGLKPAASDLFKPLGVRFLACAREEMLKNLPKIGADEGLLIYSHHFPATASVLVPELGFWVDVKDDELSVSRLVEGALQTRVLARGRTVLKGWNFLQPLGPVRRPKLTLEEPPKKMFK